MPSQSQAKTDGGAHERTPASVDTNHRSQANTPPQTVTGVTLNRLRAATPGAPRPQQEVLPVSPVMDVVSVLPAFLRNAYWAWRGVHESVRFEAAMTMTSPDGPAYRARVYGIESADLKRALVQKHLNAVRGSEEVCLKACIKLGLVGQDLTFQLAKTVASRPQGGRVATYVDKLGLPLGDRMVLADLVARRNGTLFVRNLHRFGIDDHARRVELLRTAAHNSIDTRPRDSIVKAVSSVVGLSHKERFELAQVIASVNPFAIARDFEHLSISEPEEVERIALLAASSSGLRFDNMCRSTVARYFTHFGIQDPDVRKRAALLAATVSGGDVAQYIHAFELTRDDDLYEVAKVAAVSTDGSTVFSSQFSNFGIDDFQRKREIGRLHAIACGWLSFSELLRFAFHSPADKRELARLSTEAHGLPQLSLDSPPELVGSNKSDTSAYMKFFQHYGLTREEVHSEVLPRAARERPTGVLNRLKELELNTIEETIPVLKVIARSSPEGLKAVIQYLGPSWDGPNIVKLLVVPVLLEARKRWMDTRTPASIREVANILEGAFESRDALGLAVPKSAIADSPLVSLLVTGVSLEKHHPTINFSTWDLFEVPIPQGGIGYALAAYFVAEPLVRHVEHGRKVLETLRLVSNLSTLPLEAVTSQRIGKIYEALGSAESAEGLRLYYELSMSKEVWEGYFQDALNLISASSVLWKLRRGEGAGERLVVTPETLAAVSERLLAETESEFASQFGLSAAHGVVELQERWGDLAPLTTLLARYKSGRTSEIPVLREIASHVLAGTFHDWKYSSSSEQLVGMSPRQIEMWRANPFRVSLSRVGESRDITLDAQLERVRDIFDDNLLRHIPDTMIEDVVSEPPALADVVRRCGLSEAKFAVQVRDLTQVLQDVMVLKEHGRARELFAYLKLFNGIKRGIKTTLPDEQAEQIKKDLASIREAVRERNVEERKRYLVFSTVTDDPKLLLTIGDVVNTSSCQSYRTGSVVETLPGYVIDANIKAMLSFVVAESHVKALLKMKRDSTLDLSDLRFDFDAPKLTLRVTDPSNRTASIRLGKAVCRRIIRAGILVETGEPTVMAEARYHSLHAITNHIEREQRELLKSVVAMVGAKPADGHLSFPATRNPCGVYSDRGGGKRIGAFGVKFDKHKDRSEQEVFRLKE